jgi:hypothetical protein
VVRDDLREVEIRVRFRRQQVLDLPPGVSVRVCPATQPQARLPRADRLAELPGMRKTPRRSDRFVPAEHDERREPLLDRPVGVGEAILERVLARQERHDACARHVGAEIRDEVPEVVLFPQADRAVGDEDERAAAHEAAHRMVRVDPRIDARRRSELGARRAQLGRDDGAVLR